jgi:hypothetical protein
VRDDSLKLQKVCQPFFAFCLKKVVLHHWKRSLTNLRLNVNLFLHFFSFSFVLAVSIELAKAKQAGIGPQSGSRKRTGCQMRDAAMFLVSRSYLISCNDDTNDREAVSAAEAVCQNGSAALGNIPGVPF